MSAPSFPRRDDDETRHPLAGCALLLTLAAWLVLAMAICRAYGG